MFALNLRLYLLVSSAMTFNDSSTPLLEVLPKF